MILLAALLPSAFAGSIFINGVRADLPPEMTMTNVTVRFDADGNVWIDAPNYRVQVLAPGDMAAATPLPAAGDANVSYRIPTGTWWLVTEDAASAGVVLEVTINGTLARRVQSGERQVILDIGPYLRAGSNTVVITPLPYRASNAGALSVYIGRGTNVQGTIHLDNPEIAYSRQSSDGSAAGARQYTFTVP